MLETGSHVQHMDSASTELTFCPRQRIVLLFSSGLFIDQICACVCVYMMCKNMCMLANVYGV